MNIAVITDSEGFGWHAEHLRAAFAKHDCDTHFVALPQCRFEIKGDEHCVRVPGFENSPKGLPDGVLVRNVPRGTLQEIVFYLSILHALRHCGVPVCNSAVGIERTVDKSMTSFLLHNEGIATPPLWVGCDKAQAHAWARGRLDKGKHVVVKPLFGSQGQGLQLLQTPESVDDLFQGQNENQNLGEMEAQDFGGVYYLQEFVTAANDGDWRVFVIGGKAVAAMERRSETWINNIATGAEGRAVKLDAHTAGISETAARVCGLDYAGVDLIHDTERHDGGAQVIEVNSIPAWKGLQETTDVDIAAELANYTVANLYRPGVSLNTPPHIHVA